MQSGVSVFWGVCEIHIPGNIFKFEKPFQVVQFASPVIFFFKDVQDKTE